MVIPTTGPIEFDDDIVDLFGGVKKHSLSEYYRGGGNVPDLLSNSNVPTQGEIKFSDFRGSRLPTTDTSLLVPAFDTYSGLPFVPNPSVYGSPPAPTGVWFYYYRHIASFVLDERKKISFGPVPCQIRGDEEEDKTTSDENTVHRRPSILLYEGGTVPNVPVNPQSGRIEPSGIFLGGAEGRRNDNGLEMRSDDDDTDVFGTITFPSPGSIATSAPGATIHVVYRSEFNSEAWASQGNEMYVKWRTPAYYLTTVTA